MGVGRPNLSRNSLILEPPRSELLEHFTLLGTRCSTSPNAYFHLYRKIIIKLIAHNGVTPVDELRLRKTAHKVPVVRAITPPTTVNI